MENKTIGYKFGDFYFDVEDEKNLKLLNGSYKIPVVDNNDLKILGLLIAQHPNPVKNEVITQKIYPASNTPEDSIRHSINRLRKAFDDNDKEEIIQTVRKQGYKLGVKFEKWNKEKFSPEPEPPEPKPKPEPKPNNPHKTKESFWSNEFNSWLFDKTNTLAIWTFVFVTLAIIIIISFWVFEILTLEKTKNLKWIVNLVQGIIILFAVSYSIKGIKEFDYYYKNKEGFDSISEKKKSSLGYDTFDKWSSASKIAEDVWKYFRLYWQAILVIWFILYLFFTLRGIPFLELSMPENTNTTLNFNSKDHLPQIILNILITAINYTSSLAFFLCFNILNSPTNFGKEDETIEDNTVGKGIIFIVIIISLEILILFLLGKIDNETWQYFNVVSGITAGVCMALLFGRLQSKFFNPPSWLIVTLFIYSSIQALFHYLDKPPLATPILLLALIFKSLLFLYMNFLFHSGRLLFYLIKVRKTYENVENEFEDIKSLFKQKIDG